MFGSFEFDAGIFLHFFYGTIFIKKELCAARRHEISRIVINKNECMRDKLVSVFNAVANTGASFLFQVRGSRDKVSLHVGVRTCEDVFVAQKVLASSLSGNFPGMNI